MIPRSGYVPEPRVAASATLGERPEKITTPTGLRRGRFRETISIILGASGRNPVGVGPHSAEDPRVEATLGFEAQPLRGRNIPSCLILRLISALVSIAFSETQESLPVRLRFDQ